VYHLTDRVAVYGEHEDAPDSGVVLVPHSVGAYPWWSEPTRDVLEATPDLAGLDVLDFGCGASAILSLAAIKVFGAATVTSVEYVPEFAEVALRQLEANGINPDVRASVDDGRWDFAFANLGDAALVGEVSRYATHGIGSDRDGGVIRW